MLGNEARHARDDADAIGAGNGQCVETLAVHEVAFFDIAHGDAAGSIRD
jgi:hypothetical protein